MQKVQSRFLKKLAKVIHNVIDIVITDRCLYCNWKRFFFLACLFTCSSIIAVLQDWLCVLMSSPESNRIIVHFPFIFSPFSTYFCHLLTTDPVSAIMGKMTHGCSERAEIPKHSSFSWFQSGDKWFLEPRERLSTTGVDTARSVFSCGIWKIMPYQPLYQPRPVLCWQHHTIMLL